MQVAAGSSRIPHQTSLSPVNVDWLHQLQELRSTRSVHAQPLRPLQIVRTPLASRAATSVSMALQRALFMLCMLLLSCMHPHHAQALRPRLHKLALKPQVNSERKLLDPTHAGYVPVNETNGSAMYYMFFEADKPAPDVERAPIVLWLQGGPGCSSLFGAVYLNGPWYVQQDLTLAPNPGRWNRHYGLLYVDQPIGVGFSVAGGAPIPRDEMTLARDLYALLQGFYRSHPSYRQRPLYITGESYAGKYVPSITHFILQVQAAAEGWAQQLRKQRPLPLPLEPPLFRLGGAAIGNGFTDAVEQTLVQGEVAFSMGLLDTRQLIATVAMQDQIVEFVRNREWKKARQFSDQLLAYIANCSDTHTLEDVRRDKAYDDADLTTQYFNLPHVKRNIGAREDIEYLSCSPEVDQAMGHDVMKSVSNLVPDILSFSHLLLYQGQWDAECGVASNEAWISKLTWPGHTGFNTADRHFWRDPTPGSPHGNVTLGYWKYHMHLTHMVVRNAGHMVPHDRPEVSQLMLESWIESTLSGSGAFDPAASQSLPGVRAAARRAPEGRLE